MIRPKRLFFASLAAAIALATLGCGQQESAETDEVEILCGGSFRDPMEKLVELYKKDTGQEAVLSFGQSEDLLPKVKLHAAGDVFISHDPYAQETKDAGALSRYVQVGYLAPALVVAKGNPKKITRIEDLARPGLRVALPDPKYATCGKMIFALLEKKGIKDAVLENVGNAIFRAHGETATAIKLGHRDAGVMWNGVAHAWLDSLEVVPTPYEYDQEVRVTVIGLSYSKKKEAVEKFLKYCETKAPDVFKEFGYVK
ncbi:MAG: molybdate ABC transporter substrate-binding protein [Pirellulales bacterium]|jgi:molybdate transport system substrate-binding protein